MNGSDTGPGAVRSAPAGAAFVVHGLAHAHRALEAGCAAGGPVLLVSAVDAGCFMGPAWWCALVDRLRQDGSTGRVDWADVLDCGDEAGRAMEALRLGLRQLVLAPHCPQSDAVRARAAALGALLLDRRPDAIDLAARGWRRTRDAGSACVGDKRTTGS